MPREPLVDFWRVERPDGTGPYSARSDVVFKEMVAMRITDADPHAIWWQPTAKFRYDDEKHYFGFTSLTQYQRWFPPAQRRVLKEEGFMLRRYRVPRSLIRADKAQAVAPVRHNPHVAAAKTSKLIVKKSGLRPGEPGRWVTMHGTHVFIKGD